MNDAWVLDPLKFRDLFWPDIVFYDKQEEIIESVRDNDETFVIAGNKLGKDFVAAFIALWFFISRRPARVVTSSVKMEQLDDILWGEIRRLIALARFRLPIQYNHMKIRQIDDRGEIIPNTELVGQVSNTQEGLLGRHSTPGFKAEADNIPRTLAVFDEASGVDDKTYTSTQTWAHRKLIFGNPFPCDNFFRRAEKEGDIPRANGKGFHRRVIRIDVEASPNVIFAREQQRLGQEVTGETLIPGVKGWEEYQSNLRLWDPILQEIGLRARFYDGPSIKMFPLEWLDSSALLETELRGRKRIAEAIGIDPAEGGDKTAMVAIDRYGVLDVESKKTKDTSVIPSEAIAFGRRWGVHPSKWMFDRGGGGQQAADRCRQLGYPVRTLSFGEKLHQDPKRGTVLINERRELIEKKAIFTNRRAQMFWLLRDLIDPNRIGTRFCIPSRFKCFWEQLMPVPLKYDGEGRVMMIPKNKKPGSNEKCLIDLIGHSPDESDALVLAVYAMVETRVAFTAGPGRSTPSVPINQPIPRRRP